MSNGRILLGVNIDHVATLRQQRGTTYPSPLEAAQCVRDAGADAVTLHLREDRRHIQDEDVREIRRNVDIRMNLEMAVTREMLDTALGLMPADCCLVPERREELTTEGGLDVVTGFEAIRHACEELAGRGIRASLFIDPVRQQIEAAREAGAPVVELHTGAYADAPDEAARRKELARIRTNTALGSKLGLQVNAGHGLNYENVGPIAAIPELRELNIGHAIVARAVFVGLRTAVTEMTDLMKGARQASREST